MLVLSFRIRLLLAMMLVVVTVSGITLLITQNKVQAAYERLFKEKIEAQIRYVPEDMEKRLRDVRQHSHDLARNKALLAALTEGNVEQLYQIAREQLGREELKKTFGPDVDLNQPTPPAATPSTSPRTNTHPAPLEAGKAKSKLSGPLFKPALADDKKHKDFSAKANKKATSPRQREATFVIFLNANGHPLEPSSPRWKPFLQSEFRKHFEEQLTNSIPDLHGIDSQQIGYIGLKNTQGEKRLLEIVLTPMLDPDSKQTLGAFVIAFPFQDFGEEAISAVSDIENGVWLDNTLYSRTISEAVSRELTQRLPEEIKNNDESRPDFLVTVQDSQHHQAPHRVFYAKLNPDSALPVAYKVGLYSWNTAIIAQQDLRNNVLLFGSLTLLGALALSLVIAHNFSIPLRQLVAGTAEIQKSNFSVRVPVRSRDELGQLADSFNKMAEGLALKEKYHNLLNMMADKEVAEQLVRSPVALGGETREVSVLFCDIRGFSALTQNMPPQQIVALLNEHMTALTRVVYEHDGVVDKYVGDMVMALFGAPKSYGDDTFNAVRCAAQMINVRAKLNETSVHQVTIGVSVVTGEVVAGCMGSLDRVNYTVLGDRVNLGSRLCQQADRMELIIDDNTRTRLGDRIRVETLPEMKLKGIDEAVHAYRVIEVKSTPAKNA